uniref:Glyco_transf_7N domain-containing protein n=1 Tax=Globodera pallida TaxID=36090 RepID=A0A183CHV8_GLOPA
MVNLTSFPSMNELRQKLHTIHKWGHWRGPDNCIAQQKVAIIIPYRNRFMHLRALLNNLHRFLQLQELEYQIFVINQFSAGKKADKFNRGKLLNVGFVEVHKQFCKSGEQCWDCVVFHDVDFVPENIENIYRCDQNSPKRLISATDEWDNYKYEPGDKAWLGGVVAITPDQFSLINGFSNNYWGWGAEDQNLRERFKLANKSVIFVRGALGHYKSVELVHKVNDTTNPEVDCGCRKVLINDLAKSWKIDGLTNLNYAHLIEFKKAIAGTEVWALK